MKDGTFAWKWTSFLQWDANSKTELLVELVSRGVAYLAEWTEMSVLTSLSNIDLFLGKCFQELRRQSLHSTVGGTPTDHIGGTSAICRCSDNRTGTTCFNRHAAKLYGGGQAVRSTSTSVATSGEVTTETALKTGYVEEHQRALPQLRKCPLHSHSLLQQPRPQLDEDWYWMQVFLLRTFPKQLFHSRCYGNIP